MKKSRVLLSALAVILAAGLLAAPFVFADDAKDMKKCDSDKMKKCGKKEAMCKKQMDRLSKLEKLLTEAKATAEAEGAKKTLAKIDEALKIVYPMHDEMEAKMKKCMKDKKDGEKGKCSTCKSMKTDDAVVNSYCPITGKKIDPKKTPAKLTRTYKGKKVGFCCAGCPAKWDKLSDKEKAEKLSDAMKKNAMETKDGAMDMMKKATD